MSRRVLVCDDHPVVRDAVANCVRTIDPDAAVETCGTAEDAVRRVTVDGRYDLLVLDLALPDAFGVDAVLRVRERAPALPIAVLSALDDRATVERAMRLGANRFVGKRTESGELMSALRALLGVPGIEPAPRRAVATPDDDRRVHEAIASMSPRQLQVLRLMVRGLTNRELCAELGVTDNTVKIHVGSVLRVLRARTRTEAVALAARVGFGG